MKILLFVYSQVEGDSLDLPEDDDLAQSLDMHSMVLSGSTTTPNDDNEDYPVVTAEQVIEELDEMFQCETSPDEPPDDEDRLSSMSRELQALRERSLATGNYEEGNVGQDVGLVLGGSFCYPAFRGGSDPWWVILLSCPPEAGLVLGGSFCCLNQKWVWSCVVFLSNCFQGWVWSLVVFFPEVG
ncbi:putative fasciculation and elongation protein zeta-2 [Apostichopus japonicus]|uniref:Putative fasciculation and elongation protein zeta-2 n=1 Tax=Stichopus japonicus TaxID=307972 RepID=A0A2G8LMR2_STIJA|nr:putative fasciculation and elongation protein zeta-2 [Apostichopus japonicus]